MWLGANKTLFEKEIGSRLDVGHRAYSLPTPTLEWQAMCWCSCVKTMPKPSMSSFSLVRKVLEYALQTGSLQMELASVFLLFRNFEIYYCTQNKKKW